MAAANWGPVPQSSILVERVFWAPSGLLSMILIERRGNRQISYMVDVCGHWAPESTRWQRTGSCCRGISTDAWAPVPQSSTVVERIFWDISGLLSMILVERRGNRQTSYKVDVRARWTPESNRWQQPCHLSGSLSRNERHQSALAT